MLDWTATREVRVMPKKRYMPEGIIQHPRTVELDTGKGLAVLDSCRKLGITEQDARSASQRGTVLHAERSPDHHRTLEDSLQHGPSAQQSRGPATRSRNYPDCELRTNMVGGTKTPGWSVSEATPRCNIPGVGLTLYHFQPASCLTYGRAMVVEAGGMSIRFRASDRRCSEEPLSMNSLTPSARTCRSASGLLSPVSTITGCLRSTARICFKTVTPSSSGMFKS